MIAQHLKEYAAELHLLYVEDEEQFSSELEEFLKLFFPNVDSAKDGLEGLTLYKKNHYDFIITDIQMPKLSGIEMLREIKKITPHPFVMVTSAYGDEKNLMELIDLGITRFIRKPLKQELLLQSLCDIVKAIANQKVEERYKKELEKLNSELSATNKEYAKTIRVLEHKLTQIHMPNRFKAEASISKKEATISENFVFEQEDLDELKDVESEIDFIISTSLLAKEIPHANLMHLAKMLTKYVSTIALYPDFKLIGEALMQLSRSMQLHHDSSQEKLSTIFCFAESLIFVLVKWRQDILEKESKNIHIFDASILSDIDQIIAYLEGESQSIQGEVLFF